ncbi:MAG: hypothetical protein H7282_05125 [Cytophagaceae bacterium]|nr:hypothetical protein [Cytophagaceae bacterium]
MKVNTGTVEGTIDNVQFNNGEYIATLMELIHADDIDTGKAWKQLQKDGWSSLEPIEKK